MDLAAKEFAPQPYPDVTDATAWQKLMAGVVKDASRQAPADLASPVIALMLLHESKGSLRAFGEAVTGYTGGA